MSLRQYHYEILTLKITLKIFVTLKEMETTLKNIYKGNHSDNPGLSYWNIFHCCSRTLKSHWKNLNHTEKFSALLISFVSRFFSVTLDFQCDFQCHNFMVYVFLSGLDSDMLFIHDNLRSISIFCQKAYQCWLSKENISFCFTVAISIIVTGKLYKVAKLLRLNKYPIMWVWKTTQIWTRIFKFHQNWMHYTRS